MKLFAIILLLLSQVPKANAQYTIRVDLRNSFQACTSKEKIESFHSQLFDSKSNDAIFYGYQGAVTALKAKYSSNPLKKYNFCKAGLYTISNAIAKSPADLELRYLRLVIESNIPSFLGMNCNIKEDKNIIINKIEHEKDLHLKKMISSFLLKSDICTDKEKKLLALN